MKRLSLLLASCLLATVAGAQELPQKTITLVVGFVAGGGADTAARIIARKVSDNLKQTVVIDNRAGAGGNLAHQYVATAHARRVDDPARLGRPAGGRAAHDEGRLRPAQGSRAAHDGRHLSQCPGRQFRARREDAGRVHRTGQGEAGRPRVRVDRLGLGVASRRRALQRARRGRDRPHPLQGRRAGDAGRAQRQGRGLFLGAFDRRAAHRERAS